LADLFIAELPGETRAAVFDRSKLVEMHIVRDGDGLGAGARVAARLVRKMGGRGVVRIGEGAIAEEAIIEPWPQGLSEGATAIVELVRAAWREPGRDRLAKVRPSTLAPWPAPGLAAALAARGHVLQQNWPDDVADQWDAAFEAAEIGRVAIGGGSLNLTPTPAFIAVDVDGAGLALTTPALTALARTIRLWGLGGSIVIDLPPSGDKGVRTTAAEAFDTLMAGLAFERTAINGFGLMQIVRPRPGPSILERAQLERAASAAIALMGSARKHATKSGHAGARRLVARPDVAQWIMARPHLMDALSRTIGGAVDVVADAMAGSGHVETAAS